MKYRGWVRMSDKATVARNVPQRRFPEFRNTSAWKTKPFGKLFTVGNGKDYKHLTSGNIPVYGSGGYMISVSDYLYDGESACIGRKGTINNPIFLTGKFWTVDTLFYTHSFKNCSPKFIYLIFQNINWLNHNEAGGVPSLSKANIVKIKTATPEPDEQEKIVDCFSYLNNLITTHTQKLDALQAHKKGLLQKLFPAEGETMPELRFSEFRDAPNWKEKKLNKISSSIFDGTHQTPKYTSSGIPFFSVENLISRAANKFISREDYEVQTKKNKPCKGDVLITRIGKIGYSQVVSWDYDFCIYVTLAVIRKSNNFNSYYLNYYFQTERYQIEIMKNSLLNAVPCKINMDELRKTHVLLPKLNEQRKIADCLSSLDDLIATQTQKINSLKTHKKGLMQQLFPAAEEAIR